MGVEWIRVCEGCNKIISYNSELTYKTAEKNKTRCNKCGREKNQLEEMKKINKFIQKLRDRGLSKLKEEEDRVINKLRQIQSNKDNTNKSQ